jgi:hypothetical protein
MQSPPRNGLHILRFRQVWRKLIHSVISRLSAKAFFISKTFGFIKRIESLVGIF